MPEQLTVVEVQPGLWRITDPGYAQASHAYLILGETRAGLIDAGTGIWEVRRAVETITSTDVVVLHTHAHPDHAGGGQAFDRVMAHPRAIEHLSRGWSHDELQFDIKQHLVNRNLPASFDPETFTIPGSSSIETLENRGVVDLGGRQLDVFFTPGHSPDSVCFLELESGWLFSGDSVLRRRIAIEDGQAYRRSIGELARLAVLVESIYPAHGETPIEPEFVHEVRRGFMDAITDRAPSGFLAGFATFEFSDFGLMMPPRRRRVGEE